MTLIEFEQKLENWELEDQYAEYIMDHAAGDRVICNGDTLLAAMEDGYLLEDFKDSIVTYNERI